MEITNLFTIVILTIIMTLLVVVLIYLLKTSVRTRYDTEEQKARLDALRSYLESRIFKLTDRLVATEERWRNVNHLLLSTNQRAWDVPTIPRKTQMSHFLKSFNLTEQDLETDADLVFVLTPFHPEFESTYNTVLNTCQKVGLRCMRGDEEYVEGELLPHILRLLVRARLIIANIDGRNPNVFYELGIAHVIDKPTILIASGVSEIPFDMKTRKILIFSSLIDLAEKLQTELTRTLVKKS